MNATTNTVRPPIAEATVRQTDGRRATIAAPPEAPTGNTKDAAAAALTPLVRDLGTYEHVMVLTRQQFDARMAVETAQAKQTRAQYAAHAAYVTARADFVQSLRTVYQHPATALSAFETTLRTQGTHPAVERLYRTPEVYGELKTESQKVWGGVRRQHNDMAARNAAHTAAIVGLSMQTKNAALSDTLSAPAALHVAETQVRTLADRLSQLPAKAELEHRIGRMVTALSPTEFRQLSDRLSASQLALTNTFKASIREAVLGQDRER